MLILVALILISVVVAVGFLIAFIWAIKSGQYDDTYSPAVRILFDDQTTKNTKKSKTKNKEIKE